MVHRFSRFPGRFAVWTQLGLLLGVRTGPLVQPATGAEAPIRVVAAWLLCWATMK